MNKIIGDGEIALFKKYNGGSRNGLLVIVESYHVQDPDFGSCYTFKEYQSEKYIMRKAGNTKKSFSNPNRLIKPTRIS